MTGRKINIPFWATALTIVGVIILCTLGSWQLQRLAWKTDILNKLDAAYAGAGGASIFEQSFTGGDFIYGTIEGRFLADKAISLGPRIRGEVISHDIIVPLTTGERTFFVNLGFNTAPDHPLDLSTFQGQTISIEGLARAPGWNDFTPDNIPAENIWYKPDIEEMATAMDLPAPMSFMMYAEKSSVDLGMFPNNQRWAPNNNHMQYALFWFTMAAALIAVYVLRFIVTTNAKDNA